MLLERCPWYVAGPLIGLVIVLFRALLNRPFGMLGGFIEIAEQRLWRGAGLSAYVLGGTILGGLVYAIVTDAFTPTFTYVTTAGMLPANPLAAAGTLLVAGAVMGFGSRLASGCTSGHGLTGMSLASPASVAATMTFFATAVLLANAIDWLLRTAQ